MFLAVPPSETKSPVKYKRYLDNDYSARELKNLERTRWFATEEVRCSSRVFRPYMYQVG